MTFAMNVFSIFCKKNPNTKFHNIYEISHQINEKNQDFFGSLILPKDTHNFI